MVTLKQKKVYGAGIASVIIFFALLHLMTTLNYGDDIGYQTVLNQYNLGEWLQRRYNTWSTRLVSDGLIVILCRYPVWIWRTLDVLMIGILYIELVKFLDIENDKRQSIYLALLLCSYPFVHMGSAGWAATSISYLWPLAVGLIAIVDLKLLVKGEKIAGWRYGLDILCLLFACNQELMIPIILVTFGIGLIILLGKKQLNWYPFSGILISIAWAVTIFLSPGNQIRVQKETLAWMPEFAELSLFSKIRLCVLDTMQHFVCIPNIIFMILCCTIVILGWEHMKNKLKRLVSLIPFSFGLIMTLYFFVKTVLIERTVSYSNPNVIPIDVADSMLQHILVIGLIVVIISILLVIYWSIEDKQKVAELIIILGLGLATRLALSFSPTMFASGTRTYFFMYISLIIAILIILKEIKQEWIKKLLYLGYAGGIVINVAMMWLHMAKY